MLDQVRAGGDTGGNCCVQVTPSHVHVSASDDPGSTGEVVEPPKNTTFPAAASNAIPGPIRGEGEVAGDIWSHAPRQIQVSPRIAEPLRPPYSSADCVAPSYAKATSARADGDPT